MDVIGETATPEKAVFLTFTAAHNEMDCQKCLFVLQTRSIYTESALCYINCGKLISRGTS